MKMIKVLIVDDSALIRSVMSEIVSSQRDMQVVGVAPDPIVARDLIKQTNPDVLTLEVVMVSSLTERGSEITLRALELGAVDFVTKPKLSIQSGMREYTELIADKIRACAKARVRARTLAAARVAGALPQIR